MTAGCTKIYKPEDKFVICMKVREDDIHFQAEGHEFEQVIWIDTSHTMAIHPIDGVYCEVCKAYSYGPPGELSKPCASERSWDQWREDRKKEKEGTQNV